ncbi:restriction endonuclease subunit S [Streptococcus suis]
MTKEKSTVPRLRFPGFTDAWKQRKLGEVGSTYTGLSGKTKDDFGHGDGRFVTYMNVFLNSVSSEDMLGLIEIDEKQNRVLWGDVFFTTSSETPEDVGLSSVWLGQADNIYLNSFCFGFRPKIKINPYYLAYMLRSPIVRRKIVFLAQGISRYNISKNKLMELEISLPALPEQEVIGSFFSDLDQLITLHQRKLDDVKELKKALLQKMFPKGNGNDFPELRFPEFTDAWKQRKLGEVSKRVTRRNKELISSLPLTISAQHGLVDQEEFFNKQVASKDVSSYYLIKKGEFAYNKSYSNGYPWGAIKRLDRYEMGVLSTLYIIFKPTSLICSDYLVSYYDTVNWYKEVSMIAAEGARNHGLLNIAPNDFFETRLFIPTLPEQEAIGSFFSDLDQLITLHQRQLDHLKLLKKALLQQMFI